jgi:stage II sporulation protein D
LAFLIPLKIAAQEISISLFNSTPVKGLVTALYEGDYDFYDGSERISGFGEGKIFYVTLFNKRLLLSNADGPVGSYDEILIKSKSESGRLQVSVIDPKSNSRIYSGNLHLRIEYGRILVLNEIEIEKYIAGVVEAETGTKAYPEFYKAQALLCRTYLFSHLNRHESEGFNLCDEVHCQAYKGSTPFTNSIYRSTILTTNKVITNASGQYITASFHANCGGETESAHNTWLRSEDYLVPVKDPHCKNTPNANWEKKIPLNDWKNYLKEHGFKIQNTPSSALVMKKTGRQLHYGTGKESILTRQIRNDWNLKSSYFQVLINGNTVILKGHGYGHGVGLCQDGAMNMAKTGADFEKIIHFYFKGVRINEIK